MSLRPDQFSQEAAVTRPRPVTDLELQGKVDAILKNSAIYWNKEQDNYIPETESQSFSEDPSLPIQAAGLTNKGLNVTREQEDRIFSLRVFGANIFMIADGMGGHADGQKAANATANVIKDLYEDLLRNGKSHKEAIQYALGIAARVIDDNRPSHMEGDRLVKDISDACVSIAIVNDDGSYLLAQAGDPVAFKEGPNGLELPIEPDNWGYTLSKYPINGPVLSPIDALEQTKAHSKKNQVTNGVLSQGLTHEAVVEDSKKPDHEKKNIKELNFYEGALAENERLLLTSDGGWEMIRIAKVHAAADEVSIEGILEDPIAAARTLGVHIPNDMEVATPSFIANVVVAAALAGGGADNISAIVIERKPTAPEPEPPTPPSIPEVEFITTPPNTTRVESPQTVEEALSEMMRRYFIPHSANSERWEDYRERISRLLLTPQGLGEHRQSLVEQYIAARAILANRQNTLISQLNAIPAGESWGLALEEHMRQILEAKAMVGAIMNDAYGFTLRRTGLQTIPYLQVAQANYDEAIFSRTVELQRAQNLSAGTIARELLQISDRGFIPESLAASTIEKFILENRNNRVDVQELQAVIQLAAYAPRDQFARYIILLNAVPSEETKEVTGNDIQQIMTLPENIRKSGAYGKMAELNFFPIKAAHQSNISSINRMEQAAKDNKNLGIIIKGLRGLGGIAFNQGFVLDNFNSMTDTELYNRFYDLVINRRLPHFLESMSAALQGIDEHLTDDEILARFQQATDKSHAVRRVWEASIETQAGGTEFMHLISSVFSTARDMTWSNYYGIIKKFADDIPTLAPIIEAIDQNYLEKRRALEINYLAGPKSNPDLEDARQFTSLSFEGKIKVVQLVMETVVELYRAIGEYLNVPADVPVTIF